MPIAPFFSSGTASVASADVTWFGIALSATPSAYLGDSAFTVFSTLSTYSGSTAQQRVAAISSRRGRQFELDAIQAGEASVLLRNRDGYVDPQNVSSPYYPSIAPMKRVRAVRHQAGVRYPLFDGLIERINPDYRVPRTSDGVNIGYQDVELGCVDDFEILDKLQLQSGTQGGSFTDGLGRGIIWFATIPGDSDVTVEIKCAAANTVTTNIAVVGHAITVSVSTDGANICTDTPNGIKAKLTANVDAAGLITNITTSSGTLVLQLSNTTTGVIAMSGGAYISEKSGARIGRALDSISWPAARRSIDTGLYNVTAETIGLASGSLTTALAHINAVAPSELGYFFMDASGLCVFHDGDHRSTAARSTVSQASFSDDTTSGIRYQSLKIDYSRDTIYNDVSVTPGREEGATQTVTDTASQATYLERSYSLSTKLNTNADALAVANVILAAYKTPVPRIEEIVTVDDGTTGWRQVLALEIGDLVTVRTNPPGHLTTIAYTCFVENIAHDLAAGAQHRVTLQLTQQSASTSGGGSGGGSGSTGAVLDSSGDSFVLDDVAAGILG